MVSHALCVNNLGGEGIVSLLNGIGYYEDTYMNGVLMSSMAGGCEVMFYGQGMAMDPSMISVVFSSSDLGKVNTGAPDPCKCQAKLLYF